MKRRCGYMTVEASFIIPLVYLCFMFIIYFTFFLYNHCLVYQSCYLSALRGQQSVWLRAGEVDRLVREQAQKLLDEQVYQYQKSADVTVSLAGISVAAESGIENRLKSFELYEENMSTKREVYVVRINPAEFIRQCHR